MIFKILELPKSNPFVEYLLGKKESTMDSNALADIVKKEVELKVSKGACFTCHDITKKIRYIYNTDINHEDVRKEIYKLHDEDKILGYCTESVTLPDLSLVNVFMPEYMPLGAGNSYIIGVDPVPHDGYVLCDKEDAEMYCRRTFDGEFTDWFSLDTYTGIFDTEYFFSREIVEDKTEEDTDKNCGAACTCGDNEEKIRALEEENARLQNVIYDLVDKIESISDLLN